MVSGEKDNTLPMSPSGSNQVQAELAGSESFIGSFISVLVIKDCCRSPDKAKWQKKLRIYQELQIGNEITALNPQAYNFYLIAPCVCT